MWDERDLERRGIDAGTNLAPGTILIMGRDGLPEAAERGGRIVALTDEARGAAADAIARAKAAAVAQAERRGGMTAPAERLHVRFVDPFRVIRLLLGAGVRDGRKLRRRRGGMMKPAPRATHLQVLSGRPRHTSSTYKGDLGRWARQKALSGTGGIKPIPAGARAA